MIQYVHTNIIAKDWKALAQFYCDVFGCKQVGPERHLCGQWIDDLTGINACSVDGVHLAMPGYESLPTLEIFSYKPQGVENEKKVNNQGLGHLAFLVDDVEQVVKKVIEHGGKHYGKLVRKDYGKEMGVLVARYVTDPEGNIIEVQNWEK